MRYYKLVCDGVLAGAATSKDFREFQTKHQIMLLSDEERGQYVQCGENLYRAPWQAPVVTDTVPYTEADIIAIDETEYRQLTAQHQSVSERVKAFLSGLFNRKE